MKVTFLEPKPDGGLSTTVASVLHIISSRSRVLARDFSTDHGLSRLLLNDPTVLYDRPSLADYFLKKIDPADTVMPTRFKNIFLSILHQPESDIPGALNTAQAFKEALQKETALDLAMKKRGFKFIFDDLGSLDECDDIRLFLSIYTSDMLIAGLNNRLPRKVAIDGLIKCLTFGFITEFPKAEHYEGLRPRWLDTYWVSLKEGRPLDLSSIKFKIPPKIASIPYSPVVEVTLGGKRLPTEIGYLGDLIDAYSMIAKFIKKKAKAA